MKPIVSEIYGVDEDVELDGAPFQNFLFEVRDLARELTGKKFLSGDVFWSAVDAWERNLTALDAAQTEVQIAKIQSERMMKSDIENDQYIISQCKKEGR
tara:strand:- start:190 stop:486 length:297 start_codon:yes stop_codon:yes gene_type:complete